MILHVLPGDAIVTEFKASGFEGEISVCREVLIEGDTSGDTLPEFWANRERFLTGEYPDAGGDYHETVVREFAKLAALQSGSEVNLWFEYELFCQANMWFCLSLLAESTADVYRVAPVTLSKEKVWDGFGGFTPLDLQECFKARVKLSASDLELGTLLWSAFRNRDNNDLTRLSTTESPAFPMLREVCIAAIEKEHRPREVVADIISRGESNFSKIFSEFRSRAGEYGYGDDQVKKIWQNLLA
jgi:hypothetical protein